MVKAALVDFGDTLVDQTFMRRDSERFPAWSAEYHAVMEEHTRAWETGGLTTPDIAALVAARLDVPAEDAHAYMRELCRGLRFFPVINEAMRRRRERGEHQALVTLNPDIIVDIADHYGLLDVFDVVVASWEHGTMSKPELCHRALEELGGLEPADTILLDNLGGNVRAWIAAGGHAYHYRNDETFAADVRAGGIPGFHPTDV